MVRNVIAAIWETLALSYWRDRAMMQIGDKILSQAVYSALFRVLEVTVMIWRSPPLDFGTVYFTVQGNHMSTISGEIIAQSTPFHRS